MSDHVAKAQTTIAAPPEKVWGALTDPALIKQYMFGAEVETDWQPGSPITWSGEYEGKPYEDKGEILAVTSGAHLEMTHYSALSGKPDTPENYHHLAYDLVDKDGSTELSLSQDGNATQDEAHRAQETWQQMLDSIKGLVEST